MWLIRIGAKGKHRAHIWLGYDTACRMWSTGGLNKRWFAVKAERNGRKVCTMCQHNEAKATAEPQPPGQES